MKWKQVVTVEGDVEGGNSTVNVTVTKTKSLLTGNPQKDYIYDPNLPRELNGYNLSSYPFYNGVPEDITFKCDDLHDGFYASVPHKCQVTHRLLRVVIYRVPQKSRHPPPHNILKK